MLPADDQAMVLPCASVMVIIVLLKVAFTCATPEVMFLRSRRRKRGAGPAALVLAAAGLVAMWNALVLPLFLDDSLLARDRPRRSLAGACIRVRALTADRQSLAMPEPPVTTQIHEPLDVHRDGAAQIALDLVVPLDLLADAQHLIVRQLMHSALRI